MSTHSGADEVARLHEYARDLLARFDVDIDRATRPATAASNEVWLGDDVVLRLSRSVDGSLRREAALANILPAEVGYPAVLGYGIVASCEWMVTERLPGTNLADAWPTLDRSEREHALEDLWTRLIAVHRADVEHARRLGCTRTPFYELEARSAGDLLRMLTDRNAIDAPTSARLGQLLDQAFAAMVLVPSVVAHTDAGPHNTVWTTTQAVPVDFEFACVAPADLDLENLFRTLSFQHGPDISTHLAELAGDVLALPGARARLLGYAVLRDLWGLRGWLHKAEAGGELEAWGADTSDIETWGPWLHLRGHAHGTSWLSKL